MVQGFSNILESLTDQSKEKSHVRYYHSGIHEWPDRPNISWFDDLRDSEPDQEAGAAGP